MRFLLYQHQSSDNHGCEALVYTISEQIKSSFPESFVEVTSNYSQDDKNFEFPNVDRFVQNDAWLKRFSFPWFIYQVDKRTFKNKRLQEAVMYCKPCYECAKNDDVLIAIGGDTYCYNQGREHWPIDRKMRKLNKPMMLWGCSIEPKDVTGEMAAQLGIFDIISVRESISYKALIDGGVKSKIVLCADPAFNLPISPCPLPDGWEDGKMVGINFSPMVMGNIKENGKDSLRQSIDSLISHILKNSDEKIVLIPHVRLSFSDDMSELRPIYEKYKNTGRVILIDDKKLNARELKYIISKCNLFIGARTHATIAAYSTGVPTLAIGYSIKARGLARDLFQTEENMIIAIEDLANKEKLIDAYNYITERKLPLREHLEKIMPEYKNRAYESVKELEDLVREK